MEFSEDIMDAFIFEMEQSIELLEQLFVKAESEKGFNLDMVNEIFRLMHTIKGATAMMEFPDISALAHRVEDIFFIIRNNGETEVDFETFFDFLLESMDYLSREFSKIKEGEDGKGDSSLLCERADGFLSSLSNVMPNKKESICYTSKQISMSGEYIIVRFEDDCDMVGVKAVAIISNMKHAGYTVNYEPSDIWTDNCSIDVIRASGFKIFVEDREDKEIFIRIIKQVTGVESVRYVSDKTYDIEEGVEVERTLKTDTIKDEMHMDVDVEGASYIGVDKNICTGTSEGVSGLNADKDNRGIVMDSAPVFTGVTKRNTVVNVNVRKLDDLMDLVGELITIQETVARNPDLDGLELDNFRKATRQLRKITTELQDKVRNVRMVPIGPTFLKMKRVVRDVTKKTGKKVNLIFRGEDTEIDKNVIDMIGDPLMHLVRNAIDHGIETSAERNMAGKQEEGKVVIEGKSIGSEIIIQVKDNGRGLDKEAIFEKAKKQGIIDGEIEQYSNEEVYKLILSAGLSTRNSVSELSGRGVGMDVVLKNIEDMNGSIEIESEKGKGTTISMRIPMTLAVIGGMNVRVGKSKYTIPIINIRESFRADKKNVVNNLHGTQMIMVRGECYPLESLAEIYGIKKDSQSLTEGIVVMIEDNGNILCIHVDELLGEQQVVLKPVPSYMGKLKAISGCSILGDGSVSLILDTAKIING